MKLDIQITGADAVAKALREIGNQAPYALALALNSTANSACDSGRLRDKPAHAKAVFIFFLVWVNLGRHSPIQKPLGLG